jgi:catechol 2,3-dioxygenase-like lactoylglutathione lyase family enzyme
MSSKTAPAPRRLAHVSLYVSDLQRSRRFYCDALGLLRSEEHVLSEDLPLARGVSSVLARVPRFAHRWLERALPFHYRGAHSTLCFLSCGARHHDLVLAEMHDPVLGAPRPVSGNMLPGLLFTLAIELERYAERLHAHGLEPRKVKDALFGVRLEVQDPDGRAISFLAPGSGVRPDAPSPLASFHGAAVRTASLSQALPRWQALGFQPSEPMEEEIGSGRTRLTCALGTADEPVPSLFLVEEHTPEGPVAAAGHSLDHLALELNPPTPAEGNPEVVRRMASRLRRTGLRILSGPLLHDPVEGDGTWGGNHSVYALDADGHVLEFFSGMAPYPGDLSLHAPSEAAPLTTAPPRHSAGRAGASP